MEPIPPKITGSWMDFRHQNSDDGRYWNDHAGAFSCDQWAQHVKDMKTMGMDTIVIMSTALDDKAFYPSQFVRGKWDLVCNDPLEAALTSADRNDQKVFVSAGFYGHQTEETCDAPDYLDWHKKLTDELCAIYSHHSSFYGWYIPNEAEIEGHFSDGYMAFTPQLTEHLRSIDFDRKILIAPYGTRKVSASNQFVEQIQSLGVDYIAYQDEVGVRKTRVDELDDIYAKVFHLHKKTDVALWADVEIFEFEGDVYHSPLLPAKIDRIERQLQIIAPYVEKLLCYQVHGLMNLPETSAFCGVPQTIDLYRDYSARMLI